MSDRWFPRTDELRSSGWSGAEQPVPTSASADPKEEP